MAVVAEGTHTRLVTAAIGAIHQARCGDVVHTDLAAFLPQFTSESVTDVVVCEDAVELVPTGDFVGLKGALAELTLGTDVIVVVEANRLGEAHRMLRGTNCVLQPWWKDGGSVSFGATEVP